MLNVLQWIISLLLFRRRDRIRCGMAYRNAQARLRRGDRAGAERLFEAALSCGVTDARPYVQYAIALIDGGETARAVDLLDNAAEVVNRLIEKGIAAGFPLGRYYPGLHNCLLVAVTERRTREEIGLLAEALEAAL